MEAYIVVAQYIGDYVNEVYVVSARQSLEKAREDMRKEAMAEYKTWDEIHSSDGTVEMIEGDVCIKIEHEDNGSFTVSIFKKEVE